MLIREHHMYLSCWCCTKKLSVATLVTLTPGTWIYGGRTRSPTQTSNLQDIPARGLVRTSWSSVQPSTSTPFSPASYSKPSTKYWDFLVTTLPVYSSFSSGSQLVDSKIEDHRQLAKRAEDFEISYGIFSVINPSVITQFIWRGSAGLEFGLEFLWSMLHGVGVS